MPRLMAPNLAMTYPSSASVKAMTSDSDSGSEPGLAHCTTEKQCSGIVSDSQSEMSSDSVG